tara:strand:+ start:2890 stop:3054 length:165 start_codon:yes stop_codon:yes gene_type:complete
MKFIQLMLHINVEEAETIIAFMDELKSVLVANYGDEIKATRTERIIAKKEHNSD